jgi:hypothetical protein
MKLIKEHINEKFKEDVDPISAMDIGMIRVIRDFIKKLYPDIHTETFEYSTILRSCAIHDKYDFVDYLLDKGFVDINEDDEGLLRVIVFHQNYDMAKHLISKGANLEKAIQYSKKVKELTTTHNFRYFQQLLNNEKVNEAFKEDSDPVEDLCIGLLHHISEGLKKIRQKEGVEFISLEKYYSDAWAVEIRYYNINNEQLVIDIIKKYLGENLFRHIGTRIYGYYGKVIGAGLIKKEYQEFFDKVLDDVGNINDF